MGKQMIILAVVQGEIITHQKDYIFQNLLHPGMAMCQSLAKEILADVL